MFQMYMDKLIFLAQSVGLVLGAALLLTLIQRVLNRKSARTRAGHEFRLQLMMLALTFLAAIAVLMLLPVDNETRGQLLSLFGIVLSAAIALSSTTVLGNAMAGLMLRANRSFRAGDFIRVGEHFGRVSARSLLATEIQTENRDLVTISNLRMIEQPVSVVRSSGTVVGCSVSLGYDVPRQQVSHLLIEAATKADLHDPFVQIRELGDYSVTYRVGGLLSEVKLLLTVSSRLRGCVLDALHGGGVEIASPMIMAQRQLPTHRELIPLEPRVDEEEDVSLPEELVFDKADEAESLEQLRARLEQLDAERERLESDSSEGDIPRRTAKLKAIARTREQVSQALEARQASQSAD